MIYPLIIAIIFLVPGIIMAVVPGLPGLLYMLVTALVFGVITDFSTLSSQEITVLAGITVLGMCIDTLAGITGAKLGGAKWSSLVWGVFGIFLGTFLIPVPVVGSLMGLFFGILFAEWHRTRDIHKAKKAALGGFAGSIVAIVSNGVFATAFFFTFVWFVLT